MFSALRSHYLGTGWKCLSLAHAHFVVLNLLALNGSDVLLDPRMWSTSHYQSLVAWAQ